MTRGKERLDRLVLDKGLATTLKEAQAIIGAGEVLVDEVPAVKAGMRYSKDCTIRIRSRGRSFVSRAGEKLRGALDAFELDVANRCCLDVGCSTGGFTDCLLQRGAARVYSVDVGYGVLDWKLRQDPRVVVLERTNARYLTRQQVPDPIEVGVVDVSFIALRTVLPPILPLFSSPFRLLVLVKPQFELERAKIPKGGVVRDHRLHREALALVETFALANGMRVGGKIASSVRGAKGNQEFFLLLEGG